MKGLKCHFRHWKGNISLWRWRTSNFRPVCPTSVTFLAQEGVSFWCSKWVCFCFVFWLLTPRRKDVRVPARTTALKSGQRRVANPFIRWYMTEGSCLCLLSVGFLDAELCGSFFPFPNHVFYAQTCNSTKIRGKGIWKIEVTKFIAFIFVETLDEKTLHRYLERNFRGKLEGHFLL